MSLGIAGLPELRACSLPRNGGGSKGGGGERRPGMPAWQQAERHHCPSSVNAPRLTPSCAGLTPMLSWPRRASARSAAPAATAASRPGTWRRAWEPPASCRQGHDPGWHVDCCRQGRLREARLKESAWSRHWLWVLPSPWPAHAAPAAAAPSLPQTLHASTASCHPLLLPPAAPQAAEAAQPSLKAMLQHPGFTGTLLVPSDAAFDAALARFRERQAPRLHPLGRKHALSRSVQHALLHQRSRRPGQPRRHPPPAWIHPLSNALPPCPPPHPRRGPAADPRRPAGAAQVPHPAARAGAPRPVDQPLPVAGAQAVHPERRTPDPQL